MKTDNKCPKCGGEFEMGTIADALDMTMVSSTQRWGTEIKMHGSKLENTKSVVTYRCKNCGYLESYAN